MAKLITIAMIGVLMVGGCSRKLSDTVAKVRGSVVHIEKVDEWEGSGFVVSEDGLICTAKHVVEGGGTFVVTFDDGTKYTTTQCLADKLHDVGFLKIEPDKMLTPVPLSPFYLRAGDPVFIMGSPLGKNNFNSVTLGIVSAKKRDLSFLGEESDMYGWSIMFQSDSPAYPGNSGGPVFNIDGRVVGVLVAGMDSSLNYSVPVEVFMNDLNVVKMKFAMLRFEVPTVDPLPELEARVTCLEEQMSEVGHVEPEEEVETYEPEEDQ